MQPSRPPPIPVRFGPFEVDLAASELHKRADGGSPQELAPGEGDISWSPDGQSLVFGDTPAVHAAWTFSDARRPCDGLENTPSVYPAWLRRPLLAALVP